MRIFVVKTPFYLKEFDFSFQNNVGACIALAKETVKRRVVIVRTHLKVTITLAGERQVVPGSYCYENIYLEPRVKRVQ